MIFLLKVINKFFITLIILLTGLNFYLYFSNKKFSKEQLNFQPQKVKIFPIGSDLIFSPISIFKKEITPKNPQTKAIKYSLAYLSEEDTSILRNKYLNYLNSKNWIQESFLEKKNAVYFSYWKDLDNLIISLSSNLSLNKTDVNIVYIDYPSIDEFYNNEMPFEYPVNLIRYRSDLTSASASSFIPTGLFSPNLPKENYILYKLKTTESFQIYELKENLNISYRNLQKWLRKNGFKYVLEKDEKNYKMLRFFYNGAEVVVNLYAVADNATRVEVESVIKSSLPKFN